MIIGTCMYNVQSTDYDVGVTGNYRGATYTVKCLWYHNILIRPCRLPTLQNGADLWQSQKLLWPLQNNFVIIYLQKYLLLSQNDFVNIILLRSQNLICKTNKAFWIHLTKYFVSNPNPDNRIRVTRFQQPGTRFLNRVISQLTTSDITS